MGASSDNSLIEFAEQLRQVLGHRSTAENVTDSRCADGFRSVRQILDDQLQRLMWIRNRYDIDDVGLLSSNISRASELPKDLRAEVRDLQRRLRHSIESTAWDIESRNYRGADNYIDSFQALARRERARSLVAADRALHVSFRTLHLSIDYFRFFNDLLLEQIEDTPPGKRQMFLMLTNAIIVYELTDYVINFVENFTPGGIKDLEDLHQAALRRAEQTRADVRRHVEMANSGSTSSSVRAAAAKEAEDTGRALDRLQEAWDRYMSAARQLYTGVDDVKAGLHDLTVVREGARIRIDVLEQASTLLILQESLRSVQETVAGIADFKLARLNAATIDQLLGA
jgi:hypothetical protein